MRIAPLQKSTQQGSAAVEFSIVCLLFFTILFAILEFGRMLYVYNTMQEVTRRAARAAVVRWIDQGNAIKTIALFGGTAMPAGAEVTDAAIHIAYLTKTGALAAPMPDDPGDNLSACGDVLRAASCIYSVRVSIDGVKYIPMAGLFQPFLGDRSAPRISLPRSVVIMHAESLGFQID